jgi:hypothetical protein
MPIFENAEITGSFIIISNPSRGANKINNLRLFPHSVIRHSRVDNDSSFSISIPETGSRFERQGESRDVKAFRGQMSGESSGPILRCDNT